MFAPSGFSISASDPPGLCASSASFASFVSWPIGPWWFWTRWRVCSAHWSCWASGIKRNRLKLRRRESGIGDISRESGEYGGYEFGEISRMLGLDWMVPFVGPDSARFSAIFWCSGSISCLVAGFYTAENSGGRTDTPVQRRGILECFW